MIRLSLLPLTLSMLLAASDSATCPWMNPATAAAILSGPVEMKATSESCLFNTRKSKLEIDIPVTPFNLPACRTQATPLKAIGNKASACTETSGNERVSRIVGNVRDQQFVVRITSMDVSVAVSELESRTRRAANVVVGNLF